MPHPLFLFAIYAAIFKMLFHRLVCQTLKTSCCSSLSAYYLHYSAAAAAAAAKSLQSCPTLCDPIDGSPPGSPVRGILQARTLEWVAISFSNPWKWKVKVKSLSPVWLLVTPWTAAYQAPLSMGFSRQEYWSELSLTSPSHYCIRVQIQVSAKAIKILLGYSALRK